MLQVSGIKGLTQLVELDLTQNRIQHVDLRELPRSIRKLQVSPFFLPDQSITACYSCPLKSK